MCIMYMCSLRMWPTQPTAQSHRCCLFSGSQLSNKIIGVDPSLLSTEDC